MSYILEALKKAERDRNLGQAPKAEDIAQAAVSPPAAPRSVLPTISLVLAAVLIVAMLLYLLLKPEQPPATIAAAPTGNAVAAPPPALPEPPREPAPVSAPPETPASPRSAPAKTRVAASSVEDAIEDGATLQTLDDLLPPEPPSAPPPSPAMSAAAEAARQSTAPRPSAPKPAVAASDSDRSAEEARVLAEAAKLRQGVATASARSASGTSTRKLTLDPAPHPGATPLREAPAALRAAIPELEIQVHLYNEDPRKRWVMANNTRYREGDTIAPSIRLDEITPDGVVLELRGQKVLYPR